MTEDLTADSNHENTKRHDAISTIIRTMLEFSPETRAWMLSTLGAYFEVDIPAPQRGRPTPQSPPVVDRQLHFSQREEISPKDFIFQKQPATDIERVACLAYYLTHFRSVPHFKTADINKLNTEAAQPRFSNASYAVSNATRSGFLVPAIKGAKQVSAIGERFVDTLPDTVAAKELMATARSKARGRRQQTTKPSVRLDDEAS